MPENLITLPRPARWPEAYRLQAVEAYRQLPEKTEEATYDLASKFGISGRTLYRWVRRFENAGPRGLADAQRSDAGRPTILKFPLAALFILLRRAEGLSVLAIRKRLLREWRRLYPGFAPPSYHQVRALIRATESQRREAEQRKVPS